MGWGNEDRHLIEVKRHHAAEQTLRAERDVAEARAVKAERERDFVRARIALLIEANAARLPHSCHYTGIGNDALLAALAEPVTDTTEDGGR